MKILVDISLLGGRGSYKRGRGLGGGRVACRLRDRELGAGERGESDLVTSESTYGLFAARGSIGGKLL